MVRGIIFRGKKTKLVIRENRRRKICKGEEKLYIQAIEETGEAKRGGASRYYVCVCMLLGVGGRLYKDVTQHLRIGTSGHSFFFLLLLSSFSLFSFFFALKIK